MNKVDFSKSGGAYVFQDTMDFLQNAILLSLQSLGQAFALGEYVNMTVLWGCEKTFTGTAMIMGLGAVYYENEIWFIPNSILYTTNPNAPIYAVKVLSNDPTLDPTPFATGGAKNIHNRRSMVWSLTPPANATQVLLDDEKRVPTRIQSISVPVGTMLPFAGGSIPGGYLFCNGAACNAVADPTLLPLYNIIGTQYGGSGASSFNLPDARNRTLVCASGSLAIGTQFGSDTVTLTEPQLPAHTHSGTTDSDGAHSHTVNGKTGGSGSGSFADTTAGGSTNNLSTSTGGAHTHTFETDPTGSGQPVDIRQKSLAVNMMIRVR
jgi:microcystin-dependent protein